MRRRGREQLDRAGASSARPIARSGRGARLLAAGLVLALAVGLGTASASGGAGSEPRGSVLGELGERIAASLEQRDERAERLRRCVRKHLGDHGARRGDRGESEGHSRDPGEPEPHSPAAADHPHPHPDQSAHDEPAEAGELARAALRASARKHCVAHIDADPQDDFTGFSRSAGEPGSRAERERPGRGRRAAASRGLTSGPTAGKTTIEQRIVGGDPADGFQFLELGPGEGRVLREDLARAQRGRERRRESVLYFAQTTDWQIADAQSPSRVELLDITANEPLPTFFSAAWRPQETLVPHGVETAIRQINHFADASPHRQGDGSRAEMDMVLMTGDQADNAQRNETEWTVRLMQGGELSTNSGTDPSSCLPGLGPQGQTADPDRYAGVQDYDDYLAAGLQFYDPNQPAGVYGDWPTYPGLMDRAVQPFQATGFKVPSYVTPGNHDGLAQGNQAILGAFELVGVGCIKPMVPVASLTNPGDAQANLLQLLDPVFLLDVATSNPGQVMFVPPDEGRQYVDKAQYKAIFDTGAQADAHGFAYVDPDELEASDGAASYYGWDPQPGLRMVSIDTLCEGGVAGPGASGNLDDPQFQWLRGELERAQAADKLIIVFGHHPIRSMECSLPDELAPPCLIDDAHGHDINPGCDRDPRDSSPIRLGEDLEELFHQFPNVIAYVAGHTHQNNISLGQPAGGGQGDFWGIETASLVDWPPQNRLVELMDNCDGTLSFFGTVIDSAAPATAPPSGTEADQMNVSALASVARTLAYNDPQVGPGGDGDGDRADRNVELLIDDPRAEPSECTVRAEREAERERPDRERDPDRDADPDTDPAAAPARAATDGVGGLPFTGLQLIWLALIAAALLGAGKLLGGRPGGD